MARQTRGSKPIKGLSVYVDCDLWERVDSYSRANGVSKTFIVGKALLEYMEKVESTSDAGGSPSSRGRCLG